MRKFKEVLRLKHEAGLSQRQIASALRLSLGVVNKYLNAAKETGIGWPLPEDLTDSQLRRHLLPQAMSEPVYAQPDFAALHQELKKKGVTRQLIWEEYTRQYPNNHYQYTQFCFYYQQWRNRLKLSMRQTHRAGEKMFVDYAGQTVPLINPGTGEVHSAQIFVAVLGASNYTYVEATCSQQLHDWIGSHVRAFEYFQGVPRLVVPDNLRSGVNKADRYEPILNRSYQEMLGHYGTAALPTRPRKPRDKPKVEVAVQVVERWVLARLRHHRFFSLAELNRAIAGLLDDLNHRPFKKLPGTRHSQYLALDLPALMPLPGVPYQFATWLLARVQLDYHIEVEGHYYSVPHQLVTRQLDVRISGSMIECFHQNRRVASHIRSDRHGHTTLAEHMPPHHRAQSELSPERFLAWGLTIGPHTHDFVHRLIESWPHPEMAYRSCLGLLSLARRHSPERMEAACQRALAIGAIRQSSVRSMLELGLESEPESDAAESLPVHVNVRGAAYYQ
ncbi:MAG: IS21 family transposase [Acidobacteriota bacterium]|nr:MAG: IS21 family transposase [Acidobacteriota bacterium]QQS46027.1 MAG: IS21 family transposase [Acidobacteriota bacterium]